MCHNVSCKSATIFKENFSESMKSKIRNAVLENIVKSFFRINSFEYILGGVDGKEEFAVIISELTRWKRDWVVTNIQLQQTPSDQDCQIY